jgi:CheY-like chemotaxis protein
VINDILDFSKIEAGHMDLDPVPCNLRDSLAGALKALSLKAGEKGLELSCEVDESIPECVLVDEGRLRQILTNLVSNSVKFTSQGEIQIKVTALGISEESVGLQFSVIDTGIGIRAEKLAAIFSPFTQADASTARKYGGTGLGLTISSRLAGLMGGHVWAESEPGVGSTFHFTAQLGIGQLAKKEMAVDQQLRGLRALIVDDLATNRRILERTLKALGMVCSTAASGAEALAKIEEAQQHGEGFALLLTDCQMPGMDGFELIEHVNSRPKSPATIMLASALQPGGVKRWRQLGVAACLLKPIGQSELLEAISMAIGSQPSEQFVPRRGNVPVASAGLDILLAEDNKINQRVGVAMLHKQGHRVTIASDGREALDRWVSEHFDLILMDVQMPEQDGIETTRAIRLREAQRGGHVPIIALTAHAMAGDRDRCLAAGMDGHVTKPIVSKKLEDEISRVLAASEKPLAGAEFEVLALNVP